MSTPVSSEMRSRRVRSASALARLPVTLIWMQALGLRSGLANETRPDRRVITSMLSPLSAVARATWAICRR